MRSRRASFEELYREHFGLLWSVVRNFGVGSAQLEDVLQEVWLRVYRRLHTLEPDASRKAWLCSIARNVVLHHHRAGYRRQRKLASLAAQPQPLPPDPQRQHVARDGVAKILATMDEDQRHVLVLAQVHGLSGPEIAKGLGIPLNTAYSRLRLARAHVQSVAAADAELTRREQPPVGEARKTWALLLPHLGGAAAPTVASVGLWATAKFWVPAAAAAVATMGVVATVLPEESAARSELSATFRSEAPVPPDAPRLEPSRPPVSKPRASAAAVAPNPPVSPGAATSRRSSGPPQRPRRVQPSVAATDAPPQEAAEEAEKEPSSPSSDLAAEAKLLRGAQTALAKGDAAGAMVILEKHVRTFPRGQLAEAREGAFVRALCRAGRPTEARRRAQALRTRMPGSAVAEAVANVCADEKKNRVVTDGRHRGNEGG